MKITVSVTIQADDGTPAVASDVFTLEREALAPDSLGLHLDEAKDILAAVQEKMAGEQVQVALSEAATCPACEAAHRHKDTPDRGADPVRRATPGQPPLVALLLLDT